MLGGLVPRLRAGVVTSWVTTQAGRLAVCQLLITEEIRDGGEGGLGVLLLAPP